MSEFKFQLGDRVKCRVTGFNGVIVVRSNYLTGCNRYGIQSEKLKDNKPDDWVYIDEDLLIENGKNINVTIKQRGGPVRMEAPQR
jgi:heat shock protein HspQ